MIDKFLHYFKGYNFSVDDFNLIISKIAIKNFKKNTVIQNSNTICNKLFFVDTGLLRGYIVNSEGLSKTRWVYGEGSFVTDYKTFLNKQTSGIIIETLQDSSIGWLTFDDLQLLYNMVPELNKFGRILNEQNLILVIDELQMLQENASPLARYEIFLSRHASFADLIPQRMIADMINVSPVHLSRIKSAYAKQKKG